MIAQGIYKMKGEDVEVEVIGEARDPEFSIMHVVYRDQGSQQLYLMRTYLFVERFVLQDEDQHQ